MAFMAMATVMAVMADTIYRVIDTVRVRGKAHTYLSHLIISLSLAWLTSGFLFGHPVS